MWENLVSISTGQPWPSDELPQDRSGLITSGRSQAMASSNTTLEKHLRETTTPAEREDDASLARRPLSYREGTRVWLTPTHLAFSGWQEQNDASEKQCGSLQSSRAPPSVVPLTAVSVPLCETDTGRASFLSWRPIQVSLSPGSTESASELGDGLGISDSIHHLVTGLYLLRPLIPRQGLLLSGGGMHAFLILHCFHERQWCDRRVKCLK